MRNTASHGMMRAAALGIAFAALWLSMPAHAQQAGTAPAASAKPASELAKPLWKELSRSQQTALEPMAGEWDQLDGARKQKWLDIANHYATLKPDEQLRMQERMRSWAKLTPEERRVARENYTLSKKIDKGQKTAQWEQYQQLPEEQKRKLAADAAGKKQLTNLPPKSPPKTVAPLKPNPAQVVVCPSGMIKNPVAAAPACIPGGAPAPTSPPGNPAAPVPNAK